MNDKIQERKIPNIKALQCSGNDLPTLGDNVFNVIIARNSLHFISNIPKLYDDIKFLLRSHGIFIKISSPLFDLGRYLILIEEPVKVENTGYPRKRGPAASLHYC